MAWQFGLLIMSVSYCASGPVGATTDNSQPAFKPSQCHSQSLRAGRVNTSKNWGVNMNPIHGVTV